MKRTRLTRAGLAAVILVTAVLTPITPAVAESKAGSEGVVDVGGGANGGSNTKVVKPSAGGTPVVCKNQRGSWRGNDNYYIKKFPGCSGRQGNPGTTYEWMAVVIRCVVAYDEFRFYGTVSNPVRGATVSRVNEGSFCLPENIDAARTYFPNPKDAGQVRQSLWRTYEVNNDRGKLMHLSDNCVTSDADDINCTPTSLRPRLQYGDKCSTLIPSGSQNIAAALASPETPKETKDKIRDLVYRQYRKVIDNNNSAYPTDLARGLANLPIGSGVGYSTALSSAADVDTLGTGYTCSSAIEYIPVTTQPVTDPVMLGACITPIYVAARVYRRSDNSWPRNVSEVEKFIDGQTNWVPSQGAAPYAFALTGDWAVYNDERYSETAPSVRNQSIRNVDATVAVPVTVPKAAYTKALKALVVADRGGTSALPATRDWFPERQITANGFETFVYQSRTLEEAKLVRLDRENAANSAAKGAACWSMQVSSDFDEPTPTPTTPTPTPTSSKTPTDETTPSPTPTTSSPRPTPTNTSGTSGPVQVIVTVNPKTYTVGGTSRPQTVGVTDVDVLCDGHVCGTLESDPTIVGSPRGKISLIPSGSYEECAKTTVRGCDMYISKEAKVGNIAGQSTTAMFFSPTRTNEAATVVISDEYLRVIPKRWVPPVVCPPRPAPVPSGEPAPEYEPCEPVPGYWTEDYSKAYVITAYVVRAADGGSLSRPVTGTIGK